MFICLAAVLNMGNIKFGEDENEYSFVKDKTAALATVAVSADLTLWVQLLLVICALLGINGN